MCGICGIFNFNDSKVDAAILAKMRNEMAHRGPDGKGAVLLSSKGLEPISFINTNEIDNSQKLYDVGFGHQRLSIIDLSIAGQQPMCNENRNIWITYNGEIYNFQELRSILEGKGHLFKSNTDTEVVIHAYEEWGVNCLKRFDGMFAFAIYDCIENVLFCARDRVGIKPFYYYYDEKRFIFSSEIKSILESGKVARKMAPEALHHYLSLLYVPDPLTMFKDVFKLPPGHYILIKNKEVSVGEYWDFSKQIYKGSEKDAIEEADVLFENSLRKHFIADVPVGIFLSGGIDSSLLLAYAKKAGREDVDTFSICSRQEDSTFAGKDGYFAKEVAKIFGSRHHELTPGPIEISRVLKKVAYQLDEPTGGPYAMAVMLLSKFARERVKVVLSGAGGDEFFGGYNRHFAHKVASQYRFLTGFANHTFGKIASSLPSGLNVPGRDYFRLMQRFTSGFNGNFLTRHTGFVSYLSEKEKADLYQKEFCRYLKCETQNVFENYSTGAILDDALQKSLYLDIKTFLPGEILTVYDKMSMAESLEVRVPFIENSLIDFSFNLPSSMKIKGFQKKYILKKLLEDRIPREILYRKKEGFGLPFGAWIKNELKEFIFDNLTGEKIKRRKIFNPKRIEAYLHEHISGARDHSILIWGLLMLELWQHTFLDQTHGS